MTGLKDSPDRGTGGRRKSREKPGSIKPPAHGSEDGGCQFKNVFLCMCFVLSDCVLFVNICLKNFSKNIDTCASCLRPMKRS